MPNVTDIQQNQPALLAALLALEGTGTGKSVLLQSLWNDFTGPIVMNPVYGGGTYHKSGTIYIDAAMLPNAAPVPGETQSRGQSYSQLATILGHELTHALLSSSTLNYVTASDPDAAVSIGATNEADGYAAQYVIALQLGDTSFFSDAEAAPIASPLKSIAAQNNLTAANAASITSLSSLTSTPFFVAATDPSSTLSTAIAGLHISSNPTLTYKALWQDLWVMNQYGFSVYNAKAAGPGTVPPAQSFWVGSPLTSGSIKVVSSDVSSAWTFSGTNIPISLNGISLPTGGTQPSGSTPPSTLTSSNATLTFSGSETGITVDLGTYTIYAPASGGTPAESLVYGGSGSSLNGNSGTDWFFVQQLSSSSTGTVTINPHRFLGGLFGSKAAGAGAILVDGTGIGGSASQKAQSAGQATPYQWKSGNEQYFFNKSADTMTVSDATDWGRADIVIKNFDLSAAESVTGFLGIFLQKSVTLAVGSNDGSYLSQPSQQPAVRADAAMTPAAPNFVAGTSQSYTVSVDAPSDSAQTATLTLSGAPASAFGLKTATGIQGLNSAGTFTVLIPAGETSVSFTLVNTADVGANASLQLSASLSDPNDPANPVVSDPLAQNYLEPTPDPFNTNTTSVIAGQAGFFDSTPNQNSPTPYTHYIGDGSDDLIAANSGVNSISGGNGNDLITGGGGSGVILVGSGDNHIYAGSQVDLQTSIDAESTAGAAAGQGYFIGAGDGDNTIVGGAGNDLIMVGGGNNFIVAGANDSVFGGDTGTFADLNWTAVDDGSALRTDVDRIPEGGIPPAGYEGNVDYITGGAFGTGNDTIFGGSGHGFFFLSNGNNYVSTGLGSDLVQGGMGSSTIIGGTGNVTVFGGGGSEYMEAGSGDSYLVGGGGNNTLIGGSGSDTLVAGSPLGAGSQNWQTSETGNNYVEGGSGNDVIYGAGGHDTLIAGSGNSSVYGGAGSEYIEGGAGNDLLKGGTGSDTLSAGGDGSDTLTGTGSASSTTVIYGGGGTDLIFGGLGANILYAGDGGSADDPTQVEADQTDAASTTTIYGGSGVDYLFGGAGASVIYAGDGGSFAPTKIKAGSGDTTVYGGSGTDIIFGGTGTDVLCAGDGGTDGAPTYVIAGTGVATLYGGAGVDVLQDSIGGSDLVVAGTGDDTLLGTGNDTLVAGSGNDDLVGDSGPQTYSFGSDFGDDEIFNPGAGSTLEFSSGVSTSDLTVTAALTDFGGAALEIDGNGGAVLVDGAPGSVISNVNFADSGPMSLAQLVAADGVGQTLAGANGDLIFDVDNGHSIIGGLGSDTISAWGDTDTLTAGSGGDVIYARGANDLVQGGSGNDLLVAGGVGDTLIGGTGRDTLVAGPGTALLEGVDGCTYDLNPGLGDCEIMQSAGTGTIQFGPTIALDQLSVGVSFDAAGEPSVVIGDGSATVTVDAATSGMISAVRFADGSSVSLAELLVQRGTAASSGTWDFPNGSYTSYSFDPSATTAIYTATVYRAYGKPTQDLTLNRDGSTLQDTYVYSPNDWEWGTYTQTSVLTPANGGNPTKIVSDYQFAQLQDKVIYNPDRSTDTYQYNSDHSYTDTHVPAATDSMSPTIVYDYDRNHNLTAKNLQNTDGSSATYAYSPDGSYTETVLAAPDASGAVTETIYEYDSAGNLNRHVAYNADGSTTTYNSNGSYMVAETVAASGDTPSANVTLTYDSDGTLRGKQLAYADGSSATDLYDMNHKLVTYEALGADGSLLIDRYSYANDGSYSLTELSTPADGSGSTSSVADYGASGILVSKIITYPDGSTDTSQYGAGGQITSQQTQAADGSRVEETYRYGTDGSHTVWSVAIVPGNAGSTTTVSYFDAAADLVAKNVYGADGSATAYGFDATGRTTSVSTTGADGSTTMTSNLYNPDGSYSVAVDQIPAVGGAGTVTLSNYDAGNNLLSQSSGGESVIPSSDGSGGTTTDYYGAGGSETHDAWTRSDGSSGSDMFLPNGASSGTVRQADGTGSAYINDGHGDLTTNYYDAAGAKTADVWYRSDGSYGSDTFNTDGSGSQSSPSSDGSWSRTTNDGHGNQLTDDYNAASVLIADAWTHADGSHGTDTYAANGTTTYDSWFNADGSHGTGALNSDGTWLTYSNDGRGDTDTTQYAADRTTVLSKHDEGADGSVTNLTTLADGSSVSTWANPNGNYGFSVYGGATGEERDFSYCGINDWSASDEIEFGDGQDLTAYASSNTGGYVQLLDGDGPGNPLIFSDTNFGLDPLRGIDFTLDASASNGPEITAISVSAGALQPYSSATATALSDGDDPLAALNHFFGNSSSWWYGAPAIIYASQDPSKSSVLANTSDNILLTDGIDKSRHGTQGVLSNPGIIGGGGLSSFYVGHDVGGLGREGNITADYYTEQNSNDDGSGGSDGGSSGGSGGGSSWAAPGTGPGETAGGGFLGTTTIETANGYLEFQNGERLSVDPIYALNSNGYSSWHQTNFSGSGGLS